jgi:predicted dehydrogenase
MTKKARIAVIGAGWWATSVHIPALLANPAAELVAICDADAARLGAAREAYPAGRGYTSHAEMLEREQIDGVIVATSHASHYQLARDCLARGLHVLVEKPLTLSAAHARDLVDLAREQGRELIVGYPWNYTRPAIRAREVLTSGALGAGQFVMCVFNSYCIDLFRGDDHSDQPKAYRVHGPGAVYSRPELSGGGHGHLQLTHSIGLMSFVTGLRPRRVIALMQNHGLPVDLVDAITVEFEGGALGILGGTSNARPSILDLQVHCAGGRAVLDMAAPSTTLLPHGGQAEAIGLGDGESPYPSDATSANLVDVALGRAPNGSPAEPGWRTVEILDAAYRSAHAGGRPVDIADLYDRSEDRE